MELCLTSFAYTKPNRLWLRNNLIRLSVALLPAIFAAYTPVKAAGKTVEVLSSTKTGFRFVMTIEPEDLVWFVDRDSLANAYVSVTVGIPLGSQAIIGGAEARRGEDLGSVFSEPGRISPGPMALAEVSEPFVVRGRQLVNVRIYPLAQRTLYKEVEVNLDFVGGTPVAGEITRDPVFERMFAAVVANYDEFKKWPVESRPAAKVTAEMTGPFYGAESWYRIPVTQTGIYRVSGSRLREAGLNLSGLTSSHIKMYSGGGRPLVVPIDADWSPPQLQEIAIFVEDGGDGVFDSGDYLLFFGEAQDRWLYSPDQGAEYQHHPYSERNIYWLHISDDAPGARWSAVTSPFSSVVVDTFTRMVRVEQDNLIFKDSANTTSDYFRWYWTREEFVSFFVFAPGLVEGSTSGFTVAARTAFPYVDLTVNGVAGFDKIGSPSVTSFSSTSLIEGSSEIDLRLYPSTFAPAHLDYLEFSYTSRVEPVDDRLDLPLGTGEGAVRVEVMNEFSSTPLVVNVSDPLKPELVTPSAVSDDIIAFGAVLDPLVFARYYLEPINAATVPTAITQVDPFDLYYDRQQVDLIVIAPDIFRGSLQPYFEYRQAGGWAVRFVSIENIMDNFAWGLYDPLAIRDFLKYAYENYPSPPPAAVLFVGDANYDFLDNLATGTANYVPPCIHALDQSASDDNYVYFGAYGILDSDTSYDETDQGFDMVAARWPVKSAEEIEIMIDKIMRYESPANFGIWRNSITAVADDEVADEGVEVSELIHTRQTETLINEHTPNVFATNKIYLIEYPFVGGGKPEVNDAIVNAFNKGALIVNYIGHGNPDQWAHEAVLVRANDLPRLTNRERLPIVFAASCAIGAYDSPSRQCMAEDFLAMEAGGAVGVISATRSVFSTANAAFNNSVYDLLLQSDSLSICEAMYAAKLARQYTGSTPVPVVNDRRYVFLGGPFVSLAVPRLDVEFTGKPDSLVALGKATVSGRVLDSQLITYSGDGVLYINVYDSDRDKTYRVKDTSINYVVTGPTIYRGAASINDGEFNFEFITPLDIGYGGQGAKISVYAQFDDIDGAGIVDSLAVSGSIAEVTDSTGPVVGVGFVGKHNFISGDYISPNDRMLVTISDPSGVNLAGALGHGITLEVDHQSANLINLTGLFEGNLDDYTTGSLEYPVGDLSAGNHHFKVKAWDNANNSTVFEFDAEVLASQQLAIRDLLNYPNPMRESTRFSFYLTERVERFSLELFTLSGKKIKSFQRLSLEAGFYDDIEWYGRDADGSRVATEVYIYKATAYPANGGEKIESFGKLVLIN